MTLLLSWLSQLDVYIDKVLNIIIHISGFFHYDSHQPPST